jgi:hypothetical protein
MTATSSGPLSEDARTALLLAQAALENVHEPLDSNVLDAVNAVLEADKALKDRVHPDRRQFWLILDCYHWYKWTGDSPHASELKCPTCGAGATVLDRTPVTERP